MRVKLVPKFTFSASEMGTIMHTMRNGATDESHRIANEMDKLVVEFARSIISSHSPDPFDAISGVQKKK